MFNSSKPLNIEGTIDRLFSDFDNGTISTFLEKDIKDLRRISRGNWVFGEVEDISNKLNFSISKALDGGIIYSCVHDLLNGETAYAPDRYKNKALSKRIITSNMLNSIGPHLRKDLLKEVQISEDFLSYEKSNETICSFANHDILNLVAPMVGTNGLFNIGQKAALFYQGTEFSEMLKDLNVKQIFDTIGDKVWDKLEKSHRYSIRKNSSKQIIIQKRMVDDLQQGLNDPSNGLNLCTYIGGFASGMTYYSYKKFIRVRKIKCVAQGDSCTEYEVTPNEFMKPLVSNQLH